MYVFGLNVLKVHVFCLRRISLVAAVVDRLLRVAVM